MPYTSEDDKFNARIKRLEAENKRLYNEIDLLKRELAAKRAGSSRGTPTDRSRALLEKRAEGYRLYSKKSYTAFLAYLLARTSVFRIYRKIIGVAKKYTLVTFTVRIAAYLIAAIQSSAIFVVALSLFLISLPFTLIFGYSALLISFFARRKMIRSLSKMLRDKKVAIFFAASAKQLKSHSFFANTVREWQKRYGGIAIIVSPCVLSKRGISGSKDFYSAMRQEERGIIIVRRYFYFAINKKILKNHVQDITEIY